LKEVELGQVLLIFHAGSSISAEEPYTSFTYGYAAVFDETSRV
jgi:hypothetical protein